MTKEGHLEQLEEQHRATKERLIEKDAAVFVQQGYSRSAALAKARDISETQQASADDPTGVIGTLEEAQSPTPPEGKPAQTEAIAADLRKKNS